MITDTALELRRCPRTAVLRDACVRPQDASTRPVSAVVHDLSRSGVGLSCALHLAPGTVFSLTFGSPAVTTLDCRVVHSFPVTDGWWAIGAEFLPRPPDGHPAA